MAHATYERLSPFPPPIWQATQHPNESEIINLIYTRSPRSKSQPQLHNTRRNGFREAASLNVAQTNIQQSWQKLRIVAVVGL